MAPQGGAAAVLAASSLTRPADQAGLQRSLAIALSASADQVGPAVLAAHRNAPAATPGERDVLHTFVLLGDGALRWPDP